MYSASYPIIAICINFLGFIAFAISTDYSLPVLPPNLPTVETTYNGKLIPQYIWIAVKNKEDELPAHLKNFIERNPTWKVNICDNKCKDEFMNQV